MYIDLFSKLAAYWKGSPGLPEVTVFKQAESCIDESHVATAPTSLVKYLTIGRLKNLAPCSLGKIEFDPNSGTSPDWQ